MIAPNSAANEYLATVGGIPSMLLPDGKKIVRPHRSWLLYQLRWRWLLDSWEGGEAYRLAVYGMDVRGLPVRNLIRHKREYPTQQEASWSLQSGRPAGTDPANQSTDDDYELRRARTPIPTFLADAVKRHLGKIYSLEVDREAPDALTAWWEDVDGMGTTVDHWMKLTIAPLLMVLGHLDILLEPPPAPPGEVVESQADVLRLGLDTVVASHILPENLPWWLLNRDRTYKQVVVREVSDDARVQYRYWDKDCWQLYAGDGKAIKPGEQEAFGKVYADPIAHGYGRVPIVRIFDRRRPREPHIGLPRYEPLAEIQREYYNRDSELILSDTTHVHPLLEGPEDYVKADGTIPVGPNWLLPKKKNQVGASITYEGFSVVDFPHTGAENIRKNKHDLMDAADRSSMLMKPAGAQGTDGNTVSQSGVSKRLDVGEGADLLEEIAETLQCAELRIAELALQVLGTPMERKEFAEQVKVSYPRDFNLMSGDEILKAIIEYQGVLSTAGGTPLIEKHLLCKAVRAMMPGLCDDLYKQFDDELEEYLERAAEQMQKKLEAPPVQYTIPGHAKPGAGPEPGGGESVTDQPPEEDMSATESSQREKPANAVGSHTQ